MSSAFTIQRRTPPDQRPANQQWAINEAARRGNVPQQVFLVYIMHKIPTRSLFVMTRTLTEKERHEMPHDSDTEQRGFASMDPKKQQEIASKGGKAAHERGTAHEFSPDEARDAGHKGGESTSQDREHMADIGRKGGETTSQDREHMADIGQKGGAHSHGGTHEQHVKAGEQSHKKDDKKS